MSALKLLVTEIMIMKTSKHPNIVEFIDAYTVKEQIWVLHIGFKSSLPFYSSFLFQVAMEFMGSGCLTEILDQFAVVQMTEEQMAYVALEVTIP